MNDEKLLTAYEGISDLTRQMLAAARGAEWNELLQLERECSALFTQIVGAETDGPRGADFQARKARIIRDVLDDDAEIRLLVEPWLNQLSALIGHTGTQRRLSQAYRAAD